jgi:hypothetical protein
MEHDPRSIGRKITENGNGDRPVPAAMASSSAASKSVISARHIGGAAPTSAHTTAQIHISFSFS